MLILYHIIERLNKNAAMAQMVEHILGKDEVTGSIPVSSSKPRSNERVFVLYCVGFKPDKLFSYHYS